MPNRDEIQRLAAMTNSLRPDWPVQSLVTHLTQQHSKRTYQELAVALAWVATDPATQTPARLGENGPWWAATRATTTTAGQRERCHTHKVLLTAGECPKCAEGLTRNRPANFMEIYHRAMQEARAERDRLKKEATQP